VNEQPRREIQLYFSDHFGVTREQVERYGAFDISLVADLPLFVDPFLLLARSRNTSGSTTTSPITFDF
jgi:hypothetical protein